MALSCSAEVKLCLCFGQAIVGDNKTTSAQLLKIVLVNAKFTCSIVVHPSPHRTDGDETVIFYTFFFPPKAK